jgi:hypothetical protein
MDESQKYSSRMDASGYQPSRQRRSELSESSKTLAREFHYLKHKMHHNSQIEKERRRSRMSRGLGPDDTSYFERSKGRPLIT